MTGKRYVEAEFKLNGRRFIDAAPGDKGGRLRVTHQRDALH